MGVSVQPAGHSSGASILTATARLNDAFAEIAALKATVATLEQQLAEVRRQLGIG